MDKHLLVLLVQNVKDVFVQDVHQYLKYVYQVRLQLIGNFHCQISESPAAVIADLDLIEVVLLINIKVLLCPFEFFLDMDDDFSSKLFECAQWHHSNQLNQDHV